MKLNIKQVNGLLLVLYIARAGRCSLSEASEQLGISHNFLEQIANKLRKRQILISFRGPGGGYELLGEPTVGQVIISLDYHVDNPYRMSKIPERRALGQLILNLNNIVNPILRRKVKSLNLELAANEAAAMEGLIQGVTN